MYFSWHIRQSYDTVPCKILLDALGNANSLDVPLESICLCYNIDIIFQVSPDAIKSLSLKQYMMVLPLAFLCMS